MKRYMLTYWTNDDENDQGCFCDIEILVREDDLKLLCVPKPPTFIKFIVDDGQTMIVPIDGINKIQEIM